MTVTLLLLAALGAATSAVSWFLIRLGPEGGDAPVYWLAAGAIACPLFLGGAIISFITRS